MAKAKSFEPVLLINAAGDPVEARTAAELVNYRARGYRRQEIPAEAGADERPAQTETESDKRPRRSS